MHKENLYGKLWPRWCEDEDRACMQFLADLVKSMNIRGYITVDDLYNLSEKDVLKIILNCEDDYIKDAFNKYQNATRACVYKGDEPKVGIYCTRVTSKKRYINPLVIVDNKIVRIKDISAQANKDINDFLNMKIHKYIGFNFEFKPYY